MYKKYPALICKGRLSCPLKYFILMKLTVLLITLTFIQVSAKSFAQQVSVKMKNAAVKDVLYQLTKQTGYNFIADAALLEKLPPITIEAKNKPLKDVLNECFRNQPFDLIFNEKETVVIKQRTQIEKTQQRIIKGKVIDENGDPIPGVTISVKNSQTATNTDGNGNYELILPKNKSALIFSMIGYVEEERSVLTVDLVNITLRRKVDDLDEVVVVGFGTQKKASIVGSITTIEPERLQLGTTRSLSNNLAGQLAGVIAVQRSGEPGYDNSNFWIRGISTFGGNRNPLILVDGVERSLNNMDPEEIESFSVLKDAAASAVYGVRGANGVILINTKRGKIGKPRVSVRFEQGITQPVQLPEFINAADYLEVLNSISRENGTDLLYSQGRIDSTRNHLDPDLYPDVNWLDAISKDNASNTRANFSVSGGSNMLRYSLVSSYYGENGIIARDPKQTWDSSSKLKRYNVRSNVDLDITPTTLFRLNIGGYLQDRNRAPYSVDELFQQAFTIPPFVHPTIYSSGEIPRTPQRENPWALATQKGYERYSASQIESLFSLEQDLGFILKGLKAKGIFSFDRYSNTRVTRSKSPDYYNPATGRDADGNLILAINTYGQEFLGYETGSDFGEKSTYLEGTLYYNRDFGKHGIESMFLYNMRNRDNGDRLPFRNQGIAGRFSYNYDRRYVAEFNFGYNGSENFARGKRFGFFPSGAIGWLLSEEPFMASLKNTFSMIKFRASYGLVGNDQLDGRRFPYITTIGDTGGYNWGINNDFHRDGRQEGDYGQPDLTWETVAKSDIGLELGLWNSINLQIDYFKEQRRDIFMQRRSIPGSSGFTNAPWANFGKVDNQGIDLSLDVSHQLNDNLFLSVRGTFTYAKNKIIEQDEPSAIKGTYRSSTGRPVGQLFGLIAEGLFTADDFLPSGELKEGIPKPDFSSVRPGDIRYADLNNDNIVNALDETAIGGTFDPQIIYGFGANIRYKNIDFGFFFQGNGKTYRIIGGSNFIPGSGRGALGNIYSNADDRWTLDNPRQDVFYPRLSDGQNANNTQNSTWWLRDMSMLRLRDVELGYNFSKELMQKIKLGGGRIFIRGNNLMTFSKFKLWDPELDVNNGLRYPIMKSYSFGFDINF